MIPDYIGVKHPCCYSFFLVINNFIRFTISVLGIMMSAAYTKNFTTIFLASGKKNYCGALPGCEHGTMWIVVWYANHYTNWDCSWGRQNSKILNCWLSQCLYKSQSGLVVVLYVQNWDTKLHSFWSCKKRSYKKRPVEF